MDPSTLEVEGELMTNLKLFKKLLSSFLVIALFSLVSCQSSILKHDKEDDLKLKSDIDKDVVVEDEKVEAVAKDKKAKAPPPFFAPEPKRKAKIAKGQKAKVAPEVVELTPPEPSIEDKEGFVKRRPIKDPFKVGEIVTHEARHNLAGFTAAILKLETRPFVQVNGRKAYNFVINLKTTKVFNSIYSVDDQVVTLVDYEHWLPRLYTLHVKESSQLREGRSYFDFHTLKARYEEKKVSKKKGKEEKKQEWDILPYSQNVFSVIYYMRLFQWKDGKDYSFRVADEQENLVFKGRVVGRETLETDIGPMKAIKIKPEIILRGNFKPVGDIFIWLSDDDRKIPLRIESKIKIGTIVSEITDYQPGQAP